ncbi:hypothetical protein LXL04_007621 [Taraxacum kok-saghyz]
MWLYINPFLSTNPPSTHHSTTHHRRFPKSPSLVGFLACEKECIRGGIIRKGNNSSQSHSPTLVNLPTVKMSLIVLISRWGLIHQSSDVKLELLETATPLPHTFTKCFNF